MGVWVMSETEKDAYIAANEAFREAQQTRIEIADAVRHAERAVLAVGMGPNSSAVLLSAARGFLKTLRVALTEAIEAEKAAGEKAAKEYNALPSAYNRGWGASLDDLEELRNSK